MLRQPRIWTGCRSPQHSTRWAHVSAVGQRAQCPHRHAMSHAEEPVPNQFTAADRGGAAHENEKSRLKGVFNVAFVAQQAAANPEDHRAVAGNQGTEGGLITMADEPLEQVALAQSRDRALVERSIQLFQDRAGKVAHETMASRPTCRPLPKSARAHGFQSHFLPNRASACRSIGALRQKRRRRGAIRHHRAGPRRRRQSAGPVRNPLRIRADPAGRKANRRLRASSDLPSILRNQVSRSRSLLIIRT